MARTCNIPFFLNGNSVGSYSYQSNQGARQDLYVFGARSYMTTIEQTLSNCLPQGTYVRFDIDDYLSEMIETEQEEEMPSEEMPGNPPPATPNGEQ